MRWARSRNPAGTEALVAARVGSGARERRPRDEVVGELAARLLVGRIGMPEDIADGAMSLMGNGFITGTVLHIDGGTLLV